MTVARATVCSTAYGVGGEQIVLLYVVVYDTAAGTKSDTAVETKKIT